MAGNFLDNVRERAYFKYLNRINTGCCGDCFQDWIDAEVEERISQKIEEEAYLQSLSHKNDMIANYYLAKHDVENRIRLLAYYLHEKNYNKKPYDNWKDAQRLYIDKF